MNFFKSLLSGLGAVFGVLVETVSSVVSGIKDGFKSYRERGGAIGEAAVDEVTRKKERLREVNDEIMHLRQRAMSGGALSEKEQRRWKDLQTERTELMGSVDQLRQGMAAERVMEQESDLEKVRVDIETTHIFQYNAFADILGKKCPICSRPMKLQWSRDLTLARPEDFFWACSGWYTKLPNGNHACTTKLRLTTDDFGLMTDVSAPEFSLSASDFSTIITNTGTQAIILERMDDLRSDLNFRRKGVELVSCPIHGENLVLRKKAKPLGLLDTYFLACPHWKPDSQGCSFMEKLKSGSQLAALLRSETGSGIL